MKVYSNKLKKYSDIEITVKDGKLSDHLTFSECFINQTENISMPIEQFKNMFELAKIFEYVRGLNGGKGLTPTSGCRTVKYNTAIKGNAASDHMWMMYTDGRMSMDIPVPFETNAKAQALIYKVQEYGNSLGHRVEVGIYDTFIHIGIDMGYTSKNYNWRTTSGQQKNNYYKNKVIK